MDEFKPEDELKPDPSDRRTGRSRQSSERDNEPQINFDDVDLDADDRRPARARKERVEERDIEEEYESDDDDVDEERVERRPRKRKKPASKPASRQYMMMGVGVTVLLLLIIGIGSALKAPHHLPVSRLDLARRASIFLATTRRIRRARLRLQQALSRPLAIPSRMFPYRRFPLPQLKVRHLRQLKASSVLKCRAI